MHALSYHWEMWVYQAVWRSFLAPVCWVGQCIGPWDRSSTPCPGKTAWWTLHLGPPIIARLSPGDKEGDSLLQPWTMAEVQRLGKGKRAAGWCRAHRSVHFPREHGPAWWSTHLGSWWSLSLPSGLGTTISPAYESLYRKIATLFVQVIQWHQ